jgi:hypothetical protein
MKLNYLLSLPTGYFLLDFIENGLEYEKQIDKDMAEEKVA